MTLKQTIQEDMKSAMKARDSIKLSTIRMLMAAMKQVEVDERIELDDARIVTILGKMIKQRKDSEQIYRQNGHTERADSEATEIAVLSGYLPQQMGEDEIKKRVQEAIVQSGAVSPSDMGKVMGILKPQIAGCADMGLVSRLVKESLSQS